MILVTGAAGFIGSNLLADLEDAKLGPLVVCDYVCGGQKWLNVAKREIAHLISPAHLKNWLKDQSSVDAVIHLGAISSTTESNVDLLISANIKLTIDLWDLCAAKKIPFIYASSAAAYGGLEDRLYDHDDLASLSELNPLNLYGWSKATTDRMIAQRLIDGYPSPPQWIGLRFFNVYGPNEYHKEAMMSLVGKYFKTIRDGKPVPLFRSHILGLADGEQSRDFIYVKDCTATIIWFLRNPEVNGIFNLGTGVSRSFNDLVRAMAELLDVEIFIQYVDMPNKIRGAYQYNTRAEMEKLSSYGLDHKKFMCLEDGVRDYMINYLTTSDPYR